MAVNKKTHRVAACGASYQNRMSLSSELERVNTLRIVKLQRRLMVRNLKFHKNLHFTALTSRKIHKRGGLAFRFVLYSIFK
jgi:hypothetical protein